MGYRSGQRQVQHLAAIAAVGGRSRLAAALLGFIDTSYRRVGVSRLPETDKRSYDILVTSLGEELSTDESAKLRVALFRVLPISRTVLIRALAAEVRVSRSEACSLAMLNRITGTICRRYYL